MAKIIDIKRQDGNKGNHNLIGKEATVRENAEIVYEEYGSVFTCDGKYYKQYLIGSECISNFVIKCIEVVECGDSSYCNLELVTEKEEVIYKSVKMIDFTSAVAFKKAICKDDIRIIFKGSNKDLEDIKGILNQKFYLNKTGIEYSGIVKHLDDYFFVGNKGSLDKSGKVSEDIVLVGSKSVKTGILDVKSITKKELSSISYKLFNFNSLDITATVLGYSAGCFLREMLYQELGKKSPHLILCGEAGSGKSETGENIIKPIFSIDKSTSVDQCTRFVNAYLASGSNMLPFIIEEYKPSKLTKTRRDEISALLRNAYDRTPGFRGNVEQKLNTYPLITPIVLIGEMAIDESATLERSILVYFSKQKISSPERKQSFSYLKEHKKILSKFGRALLEQALKTDIGVLSSRYESLSRKYQNKLNNRTLNSAVNTMLGIWLIADLFQAKGLDFQNATGYEMNLLFDAIADSIFENIMEGCRQVKGIIEKNIEVLNEMVETGDLTNGIDYQLVNNGSELALNVKLIYPKLMKYTKNHNLTDMEILSQKQFTTQIKLKEYYLDYKAVRFLYNQKSNCTKAFVVNVERLKKLITIDNLCL